MNDNPIHSYVQYCNTSRPKDKSNLLNLSRLNNTTSIVIISQNDCDIGEPMVDPQISY